MKLSNIRCKGRYKNTETGKCVNIKTGRNMQRGTDNLFYLRSGERIFISDRDFYLENKWSKVVAVVA